jgi:hypothetical protein
MTLRAIAGASSFAHLLGRAPKAAKAKDDEKDPTAEELDEEKGDGDDEGDGPQDGKGKNGKKAESPEKEEDDADREEREDDEKGDDAKKGKKAKSKRAKADDEGDDGESGDDDEDGDDDSDDADMRKKGTRSARLRERARCAAIFADPAAGKNPALAARLAFNTNLPRSQAVACLQDGGTAVSARRASLDERMSQVSTPRVGASDPGPGRAGGANLADQIIAAGKRRRGEA